MKIHILDDFVAENGKKPMYKQKFKDWIATTKKPATIEEQQWLGALKRI
jgi:hypothetical protein